VRDRHWTVVIVGTDTEPPRTLRVSQLRVRLASWAAGVALTSLLVLSVGAGFAYGHRDTLPKSATAISNDPAVALATLSDSVASLGRQATALRVVAGLDLDDSAPATGASVDMLIDRADRLSTDMKQVAAKLHSDADRVAHTPSIMPTAGWLSSQFSLSRFHPILHKYLPHLGIDIAAPYGTTIVAPAAGTVIRAGQASGYGWVMEIDHGNGIVTKYGHLRRFLVHVNQQVVRGQPIAEVGNSGLATGPHLHYEVHVDGRIVDPLTYVLPESIPDRVVSRPERTAAAPED
jgi:murein DD-endopeptidase MepM/ murein hydrolase activator NlpD